MSDTYIEAFEDLALDSVVTMQTIESNKAYLSVPAQHISLLFVHMRLHDRRITPQT